MRGSFQNNTFRRLNLKEEKDRFVNDEDQAGQKKKKNIGKTDGSHSQRLQSFLR